MGDAKPGFLIYWICRKQERERDEQPQLNILLICELKIGSTGNSNEKQVIRIGSSMKSVWKSQYKKIFGNLC